MISREEKASKRPHCSESFTVCVQHQKHDFRNMGDLKCEICFERVNQPEEKHQGEVDQEKEAVSVLGALHEDCQLFGPGQQ